MPSPSLLPLRIVENGFAPVASGRLFRPRTDIGNGILAHGHRVIETAQPDAHPTIIPNARDFALDFDDVALGYLFSHIEYLAPQGVSAR